jgi:hypothetical protein
LSHLEAARELAATALFAVVDLSGTGGPLPVYLFAVGDSAAWILRGGQTWERQHRLKSEEDGVVTSSTAAVPLKRDGFDPPVVTRLDPGDVLVLMTDGIGDPLGDGTGSVGRFLARMWRQPPVPLAFAAQVDFARRSHDDDRTAVAIWRE